MSACVVALLSNGEERFHSWSVSDDDLPPFCEQYDYDWMRYCCDLKRDFYSHVSVSFCLRSLDVLPSDAH